MRHTLCPFHDHFPVIFPALVQGPSDLIFSCNHVGLNILLVVCGPSELFSFVLCFLFVIYYISCLM
uniref:Uncharacterized protein n=1 Tax=Setaria italica TaxID=4555 RepID=K3Z1F6_SETIT